MYNLLEQILVDIKVCYGSFSEPDWGFQYDKKDMCLDVINDLNQNEAISSFFSIEDVSDYMEFGYGPMLYLLHNNQAWWLYLSIVAKYAYFYKMFDGHNHKNISYCENCDFPEEIEIITILKKHAIIPLTEQIVSLQIPEFKLREYISGPVEIPTIENILFCDV